MLQNEVGIIHWPEMAINRVEGYFSWHLIIMGEREGDPGAGRRYKLVGDGINRG